MNTLKKFWLKVVKQSPEKCWPWAAAKTKFGYGVFTYQSRYVRAHRFAWMAVNGKIPKGLCVLHRCDNPSCVNPSHLFLGTHQQNVHDRHRKGRSAAGTRFKRTKLTESQVLEIRSLYQPKYGMLKKLGDKFHTSQSNVYQIVTHQSWKHLKSC